jgi:phytoene dehydrogenase-like protein
MQIIIVGAGLAGLTCARLLLQKGHELTLYEASDGVGGRVRSDYADGCTFDRGFQVLFDSYPAARQLLDLAALDLRAFEPGAIICRNGQFSLLTDPLRDPEHALPAALNPIITPLDKLRTLRLALEARFRPMLTLPDGVDATTLAYLQHCGFSQQAIDVFFRPFFGGIFLDRELVTSSHNFRFYFAMLSVGSACVPARGMQAISDQLAAPLQAAGVIHTQRAVAALLYEGERVVGVRLADGCEQRADAVVVATHAPEAARLSGEAMPTGALQTVNLYFVGRERLYPQRKILLNAAPDAFVNNAQLLTNVAPTYAPDGQHLLSVTVLGNPQHLDDEELFLRAMADLRVMLAGNRKVLQALAGYEPLRLYRIPFAQFAQPPGRFAHLPSNRSRQAGLYFAGEFTEASSINAALNSGMACAALL